MSGEDRGFTLKLVWAAIDRLGLLNEVLNHMEVNGYNESVLVYCSFAELGYEDRVNKEIERQFSDAMAALTVGLTEMAASVLILAGAMLSLWFLLVPPFLAWHGWHIVRNRGPRSIKKYYDTVVIPKIASRVGSPDRLAALWVR